MIRVLFVCLGNICRSPLAEGIFRNLVEKEGVSDQFFIDSAGTGNYHIGELADPRTRSNAQKYGLELTHRARQLKPLDLTEFDYILTADHSNYERTITLSSRIPTAKVIMMRAFDPVAPDAEVPDPYYGQEEHFEEVYQILLPAMKGFLAHVRKEHNI